MNKNGKAAIGAAAFVASHFFAAVAFADHQDIHSSDIVIKLQDLIGEALKNNAAVRSSEQAGLAKEASVGIVGSLDNPELGFEARNYPAGSEGMSGGREREISLSQRVSFPGKRAHL